MSNLSNAVFPALFSAVSASEQKFCLYKVSIDYLYPQSILFYFRFTQTINLIHLINPIDLQNIKGIIKSLKTSITSHEVFKVLRFSST